MSHRQRMPGWSAFLSRSVAITPGSDLGEGLPAQSATVGVNRSDLPVLVETVRRAGGQGRSPATPRLPKPGEPLTESDAGWREGSRGEGEREGERRAETKNGERLSRPRSFWKTPRSNSPAFYLLHTGCICCPFPFIPHPPSLILSLFPSPHFPGQSVGKGTLSGMIFILAKTRPEQIAWNLPGLLLSRFLRCRVWSVESLNPYITPST
jgi:hypothetical protein